MAPVTSVSVKSLPVINTNCALRRNVRVQPYGRCSVCSLQLSQCHAWQSSAMSFLMVVLVLVPLFVTEPWLVRGAIASALALLVWQGTVHHRRTDELIEGQHRLSRMSAGLERQVEARTGKLRETNAALARANLELEALVHEREKMVLDVSHDLRTPMTSVKGAAQNLLDGVAGPLSRPQREYVEIVHDHAGRLVAAVTALLDRARRASAPVELESAQVDLAELASEVVRGLQPMAAQKGVAIAIDRKPAPCMADVDKLRKVLENLVGNALKFTDRGGEVRVSVEGTDSEVRVLVRDNGLGIEESELPRLFDRFYTRAPDQPGSGLGLAITRDLVRLHRGDITVTSRRGEGSEFAVFLPRGAA